MALAADLLAWMQILALTAHPAHRWEPKRPRLRLLAIAGRLTLPGRRCRRRLTASASFTSLLLAGLRRLELLTAPRLTTGAPPSRRPSPTRARGTR